MVGTQGPVSHAGDDIAGSVAVIRMRVLRACDVAHRRWPADEQVGEFIEIPDCADGIATAAHSTLGSAARGLALASDRIARARFGATAGALLHLLRIWQVCHWRDACAW